MLIKTTIHHTWDDEKEHMCSNLNAVLYGQKAQDSNN